MFNTKKIIKGVARGAMGAGINGGLTKTVGKALKSLPAKPRPPKTQKQMDEDKKLKAKRLIA